MHPVQCVRAAFHDFRKGAKALLLVALVACGIEVLLSVGLKALLGEASTVVCRILRYPLWATLLAAALQLRNGQRPTVKGALQPLLTHPLQLIGIGLVAYSGVLLFGVGVLVTALLSMFAPLCLLNGDRFLPSLRRSQQLISQHPGRTLTIYLLLVALNVGGSLGFGIGLFLTLPLSALILANAYESLDRDRMADGSRSFRPYVHFRSQTPAMSASDRVVAASRTTERGATFLEHLIVLALVGLSALGAFTAYQRATSNQVDKQAETVRTLAASGHQIDWPSPSPALPPWTPEHAMPPKAGQAQPCDGFWECFKERVGDGVNPWEEFLNYQSNFWGAAWEDVRTTFSEGWDLVSTLISDPGSLYDDAREAIEYALENPLEAAKSIASDFWETHVWDDESTRLWNEGDYWGLVGRESWKVVGQHASYFIPGAGWAKAGLAGLEVFDSFLDLGRRSGGDTQDGRSGSETSHESPEPEAECSGDACSRPDGPCFAAGTPVHTATGLRPIEGIRVGDEVWSRDEHTGKAALQRVQQRFVTHNQPILALTTANDSGTTETLRVTHEHPFWTSEGWVAAEDLAPNDAVQLLSEEWVTVVAGQTLDEQVTVYNFEVAQFHTYFVGAYGLWVHNSCDLLGDDGKFKDSALEERYARYVDRKNSEGKPARDREDWKRASDYWLNDSPTARGNRFNETRRDAYPYSEVNLEDGTRVDSYDPERGEIIERKASDFDIIERETFERYLNETLTKYPSGKPIRSNKYPELDGEPLQGKHVLEVPDSNLAAANRLEFERIARDKGFEIRYVPE